MIRRPAWEESLRRKLRKWGKRPRRRGSFTEWGSVVVALLFFSTIFAKSGVARHGAEGGATGIGMVSAVTGCILAMPLQTSWMNHGWLLRLAPATLTSLRRVQTRETLPGLIAIFVLSLAVAILASSLVTGTEAADSLIAAALCLLSGFLLAGGAWSAKLLGLSFVGTIGYGIIRAWFDDATGSFFLRAYDGAVLGWLPVFPWALATHGTPVAGIQAIFFVAVLWRSLCDWRKCWQRENAPPVEWALADMTGKPGADKVEPAGETSNHPPADEDQRKNIRQQVAFAWFGLAGYLPDSPMPMIDRLVWRWLTPRQRLISTLGSHDAFGWFAQTKWAALSLVLLVSMTWLSHLALDLRGLSELFDGDSFWWFMGIFAPSVYAAAYGWPARRSRFKPWLESMEAQGIGQFPSFALLPVCPGDWLRAAAKEWAVRSAWMALLWTLAIAAALPAFSFEKAATTIIAWLLLPWLLGAALFPLSSMNRLVRAVSGPMLRSQGFSRTIPAILLGVLCPTATAAAALALGVGLFLVAIALLSVGAVTGWASLALTLNRCRNMRFDLRPKPLH